MHFRQIDFRCSGKANFKYWIFNNDSDINLLTKIYFKICEIKIEWLLESTYYTLIYLGLAWITTMMLLCILRGVGCNCKTHDSFGRVMEHYVRKNVPWNWNTHWRHIRSQSGMVYIPKSFWQYLKYFYICFFIFFSLYVDVFIFVCLFVDGYFPMICNSYKPRNRSSCWCRRIWFVWKLSMTAYNFYMFLISFFSFMLLLLVCLCVYCLDVCLCTRL